MTGIGTVRYADAWLSGLGAVVAAASGPTAATRALAPVPADLQPGPEVVAGHGSACFFAVRGIQIARPR